MTTQPLYKTLQEQMNIECNNATDLNNKYAATHKFNQLAHNNFANVCDALLAIKENIELNLKLQSTLNIAEMEAAINIIDKALTHN